MCDLVNIAAFPSRFTNNTKSLPDVFVRDLEYYAEPSAVADLGFPDHQGKYYQCLLKTLLVRQ
jgi:hypothetical protein